MKQSIIDDNKDFLKNLVDDLKPVSPLWSPEKRFFLWLSIHLLAITTMMLLIKPFRADFVR